MKNNYCIVNISANFNQTMIVAIDEFANVLVWNSTTFNNKTAFTDSYKASIKIAIKLKKLGIDNVDIVVRGIGLGREAAIRAIMDSRIHIKMIKDKTPVPHVGCVPLKRERKHKKA